MSVVWAAINTYLDAPVIEDCLKSLRAFLPLGSPIIAIDGVYRAFAEQSRYLAAECESEGRTAITDEFLKYTVPISNDGTLKILTDYGVRVLTHPIPWENEQVKRSQYLGPPAQGDWIFVIDSDERLTGPFPTVQELESFGGTDYCVPLQRDDGVAPYPIMRVHKKQGQMEYLGAHFALHRDGKLIKRDELVEAGRVLTNVTLFHFWHGRAELTPIRQEAKGAYYRRLLKEEEEFRDLHGV